MIRRLVAGLEMSLVCLAISTAQAQPKPELRGKVFHLGENGEEIAEAGLIVTWEETGSSRSTNDLGLFRLPLLPGYRPGAKVTLSIDKPGWRIRRPFDGEVFIPASLDELIKVELLPAGSRLFWSNDRIEKFIRDTAEKARREEQTSPHELGKKSIDFGRYIQEWAARYGFSAQDAQREIDRWIAETEANQNDVYKLGLAAFAKKQFADAARLFHDSADWRSHEIEEIRRRREALAEKEAQLRAEQVRDLELEGDSYFETGDYARVLAIREQAHGLTSRTETPELWANSLLAVADSHYWIQLGAPPIEAAAHLEKAIQAVRQALLVFTLEQFPQEWARAQCILATNLDQQAALAEGEPGNQHLAEALEATRQALRVFTPEQFPEDWAKIQRTRGDILLNQAKRTEGQEGALFFTDATESYYQALRVLTREQFPQEWAGLQNSMGYTFLVQATRAEGERKAQLLASGSECFQHALEVFTYERFPGVWIISRSNQALAFGLAGRYKEALAVFLEVLARSPASALRSFDLVLNDPNIDRHQILTFLQGWLASDPKNPTAGILEISTLFVTGDFVKCKASTTSSLAIPGLSASQRIVLLSYAAAAEMAADGTDTVSALATLVKEVEAQPAQFRIPWNFPGTLLFLREHHDLSRLDLLARLFPILRAGDRDSISRGLKALQSEISQSRIGTARFPPK
jgi:tetratricopeptide (TPR) repeat protein